MFFFPYNDINPTERLSVVTWLLITVNAGAFIYLYWILMPNADVEQLKALSQSYQGCRPEALSTSGRLSVNQMFRLLFFMEYGLVPGNISTESWQVNNVLTSMFLHGSLTHLIGNMVFLWITGDNLEDRFGYIPFTLFYLFCGFAAAATQVAMNPDACVPMVGASGAIAGTMGAYMVLFPRGKIKALFILFPFIITTILIDAIWWLGLWFLFQFAYEFSATGPGGVAHWAHIGGFTAGLLIALIARYTGFVEAGVSPGGRRTPRQERDWHRDSHRRW